MVKLKKFAKDLGITRMTLWNWMYSGKIKFHKIGSMNYVDDETYNKFLGIKENKEESVVIYARVSSTINKTNLDSQSVRLQQYCNAKGYKISKVITEFGSGLNDKRPKLLKDQDFTKLVVEHKDRLTRFGFNYIETCLNKSGIEIEVVNPVDNDKEDIVQDFVSVITSFCARIYGQRRSKRKTEVILKELESTNNEPLNNYINQ